MTEPSLIAACGFVFVGVEELVDAGFEAGDDGGFLVGEACDARTRAA